MIVVAGFNTALDTLLELESLRPGAVQRCRRALRLPGGKGLHVAQTAAGLGAQVVLVGLVDAVHRELVEGHLHARGVRFVGVEAPRLRECLALRESDGRITELLEDGPDLDAATCARLRDAFLEAAAGASLAVLSGSLPRGCAPALYAELVAALQARGVRCLVDASGEALARALDARPFLAKPNRDEASALLGRPIDDDAGARAALAALRARGIAQPALTLGAGGALLADGDLALHGRLAPARVLNPVGSGDCLLAGLAVALERGAGADAALRLGLACGAANAAAPEPGYAAPDRVRALLPHARIDAHPLPPPQDTRP